MSNGALHAGALHWQRKRLFPHKNDDTVDMEAFPMSRSVSVNNPQSIPTGGSSMEIIQDDTKKLVQVWLTRNEAEDDALQRRLKPMYGQWKQQKYMVAVFRSGKEDLQKCTLDLLAYNKKRCAELAVRREKRRSVRS